MRFLSVVILLAGLFGCSSNISKNTLYPYIDNRVHVDKPAISQVMIASVNLGVPSRHYLTKYSDAVDRQIEAYLKKHEIRTVSNKPFEQQWKNAEERYGVLFNSISGELSSNHPNALKDSLDAVFANNPHLDAVVFTDLIETNLQYQEASQRYAEWHGVQRRLKIEGVGEGIPITFDWSYPVEGISIAISIYNRQHQLVFHSVGGIQVAQAIVLGNTSAQFRRRRDLLANEKEILEGIQLAFHPFISMKKYPQTPQQLKD